MEKLQHDRRNKAAALETVITIVEKYYGTLTAGYGLKVRLIEKQPVRFFFFFFFFFLHHLTTRYTAAVISRTPCRNEACTFPQTPK